MFTGIVSGVGTLHERRGEGLVIAGPYKRRSLAEGASIACDGCCLTIVGTAKAKGEGARFAGLVHHTDAAREYAYDRDSKIGKLDKAWDDAVAKGWTVVDMKSEWNQVFAFE